MNSVKKRAAVAAGALAAAGLFGSLPFDGSTTAQSAVPTQHHDVALVDVSNTDFLTSEADFNSLYYNDILGTNGVVATVYNDLVGQIGQSQTQSFLDVGSASPAYTGAFDGAETHAFQALFVSGLALEDHYNQLLGFSEAASQGALLTSLQDTVGSVLPSGSNVTLADLTAAVGSSTFDSDLTSIANAGFTQAIGESEAYFASFLGNGDNFSNMTLLFGDLTNSFDNLANLASSFTNLIIDAVSIQDTGAGGMGLFGGLGGDLLGGLGGDMSGGLGGLLSSLF